jgi:hypothetical protein
MRAREANDMPTSLNYGTISKKSFFSFYLTKQESGVFLGVRAMERKNKTEKRSNEMDEHQTITSDDVQTVEVTEITETPRKRAPKRTPQEMYEFHLKEAEKALARAEGRASAVPTSMMKRLTAALKRRNTLLGRAQVVINGKLATAKSPATNTIEQKIENAIARVADLRQTQSNAIDQLAQLPEDIERLTLLIEEHKGGTDVEFPTDLYRIPGVEEQTDSEAEFSAAINQEDNEEVS